MVQFVRNMGGGGRKWQKVEEKSLENFVVPLF